MRHLCIFISLIFLNQVSHAVVTVASMGGLNSSSDCSYQGTVIDLKKVDSDMELVVNIENNLDGYCSAPLDGNISFIAPENKEIQIGSDVKFSINKTVFQSRKNSDLGGISITEFKFNHWE